MGSVYQDSAASRKPASFPRFSARGGRNLAALSGVGASLVGALRRLDLAAADVHDGAGERMKAIVVRAFGGPEQLRLEDVPDPAPGLGEVLVRVHAVSVNTTLDVHLVAGASGMDPALPFTPGVDPSGVVEAVGEGVTSLKVGDRVAGTTTLVTFGGYAELVVLRESRVSLVPGEVDFPTATVVRRHFGMAHSQVEAAGLQAGESVLVMGAAGARSVCLIQLAKEAGATVLAGAGSAERVAAALTMGADHGINYRDSDLVESVLAATDGRGVDVVFENVGDPRLWPKAIESMAVGGRLLTIGTHAGDGILPVDVRRLYRNRLKIIGGLGSSAQADDFANAALRGVAEGRYRVLIDRVLPLAQAADAFRLIAANAVTGKVILHPIAG